MSSTKNLANLTATVALYSFIFVVSVGLITNILNIRICLSKKTRNTALGFYNLIIAIFNIVFLIVTFLSASLSNVFDWTCILGPLTVRILYQMISWLNVMVSFDRLFLSYTYQPHHNGDKHENRKRLSFIILGIFGVLICVNVSGVFYHLEKQQSTNQVKF